MKKENEHRFEHLLNWVEGRLSAVEAEELEAQLETAVDDTQALIEWLQMFQELSQKYRLASPPDTLDEQLYNIFTENSDTNQRPHLFQRLLATLTFDSYHHFSAMGVRAAATKLERQYVYSTNLVEIAVDLQWETGQKSVHVHGQLFPVDETDETIYMVELQRNKTTMKMTPTDELGKFAFSSLVPDTYDIILSSYQNEITITDIELQF